MCCVLFVGCWLSLVDCMLVKVYRVHVICLWFGSCSLLFVRYCLVVCCWLFVVGCLLLVVVCRLLMVGYWLSACCVSCVV